MLGYYQPCPTVGSQLAGPMDKKLYSRNQRILLTLLREIRLEMGLRQQEVADRIQEPQSFVSKVESGDRRLDLVQLHIILNALEADLVGFVTRFVAEVDGKRGP